jgi:hypothetical protein
VTSALKPWGGAVGVRDEGVEGILVALRVPGCPGARVPGRQGAVAGRVWAAAPLPRRTTVFASRPPIQRPSGISWSKDSDAWSPSREIQSLFLRPSVIWLITAEPIAPRSVCKSRVATSSVPTVPVPPSAPAPRSGVGGEQARGQPGDQFLS